LREPASGATGHGGPGQKIGVEPIDLKTGQRPNDALVGLNNARAAERFWRLVSAGPVVYVPAPRRATPPAGRFCFLDAAHRLTHASLP
jgi:hypothetical protein